MTPLHPILVHYPIVCLTLLLPMELIGLWLTRQGVNKPKAANEGESIWFWPRFLLTVLGGLAILGLLFLLPITVAVHPETEVLNGALPEAVAVYNDHQQMAFILSGAGLAYVWLLVQSMRAKQVDGLSRLAKNQWIRLALAAVIFGATVYTGWLGGQLVHHYGVSG